LVKQNDEKGILYIAVNVLLISRTRWSLHYKSEWPYIVFN